MIDAAIVCWFQEEEMSAVEMQQKLQDSCVKETFSKADTMRVC